MHRAQTAILAILASVLAAAPAAAKDPASAIGLGRTPTAAEIVAWDIAIGPDGKELPVGKGNARDGKEIYRQKCSPCHGATGTEGPRDVLVGGKGSLATAKPLKTIGSYWPYATTIYDYISRAMPFNAPGSLTPDEVYALTAFLLYRNGIVEEAQVMDANVLPRIVMPNRNGFRADPRPDTGVPRGRPSPSRR